MFTNYNLGNISKTFFRSTETKTVHKKNEEKNEKTVKRI